MLKYLQIACLVAVLPACSFPDTSEAKAACAEAIRASGQTVTSDDPAWRSYAGTGGSNTTLTYPQTQNTPGITCVYSGGEVTSLTESRTTTFEPEKN